MPCLLAYFCWPLDQVSAAAAQWRVVTWYTAAPAQGTSRAAYLGDEASEERRAQRRGWGVVGQKEAEIRSDFCA